MTNSLKVSGLEASLKLNKIEMENKKAKGKIQILEDIANYDELTKIFNRRYLEIKYDELLKSKAKVLSLAMVDIDYFKEFNDNYGHLAGDDILKAIAACLQSELTSEMLACRYGGDEFVVLCWGMDTSALYAYTQKIQEKLHSMAIKHDYSLCSSTVTASIGCAEASVEALKDVSLLLELADKALYKAKAKGRNCIVKA